jgi:hypothetical protein
MSVTQESVTFRLRKPLRDALLLEPTNEELQSYFFDKYGSRGELGENPALRLRHRFVSADDYYEVLVGKLVQPGARWLDVGCGRDVFPSNYRGAKRLAERCTTFVGVDPDENVHENDLLTDRFQGPIEEFDTDQKFDLITLRMVAEHVRQPEQTVAKLAELTASGGLVVIYTPWKWAPMSVAANIVPFEHHNRLKRLIWDTDARDTFPTVYKMNTRRDLQTLFEDHGFDEAFFCRLDDCSVFAKHAALNTLEIALRNGLRKLGLMYPEHCLVAVFKRV